MRVRTGVLSQMLVEAERDGIDIAPEIARVGLNRADIDAWRVTVPGAPCMALWDRLLELSDDPLLPLRAADAVPFGAFDVIDHLGAQVETVGALWVMLARYFGIVNTIIRPRVQADPEGWCVDAPGIAGRTGEIFFAVTLSRLHLRLRARFVPMRVELARARTGPEHVTARIFGEGLCYGQARTAVILSDAQFNQPLPAADPALRAVLEAHARLLIRAVDHPQTLAEEIEQELEGMLGHGELSLARIAKRLGMSARTVQRRLKAEGDDFRAVLARTRRAVAERHLEQDGLSVEELAFLLGYADGTALQRAFKGWTGLTIGQWRKGRAAG